MKEERKLDIDLLRIVACISVIMLHSASQFWYDLPVAESRWIVINSWDAVSRFGVPVFVMISGMLFLSRKEEIRVRKLYTNNILRLAAAYLAWSAVYGLWDSHVWWGAEGVTLRDYAAELVLGRYHLWFIPMLICIYVLLPVIKSYTDHCSRKNLEYFLLLFLIFQIGKSTLGIFRIPTLLNVYVELINIEMVCSYVGYFILGYYLYRYPLSGVWRVRLYFAGGCGLLLAAAVSTLVSLREQLPRSEAFDSYSIFTFLVSCAVFVFFREKAADLKWSSVGRKLVRELSANTFGVYLMHLLVMEILQSKGIHSLMLGGILTGAGREAAVAGNVSALACAVGVPVLTVICFVMCNVMVSLLRRIPLAGRFIC